jgi:hypothetical protein
LCSCSGTSAATLATRSWLGAHDETAGWVDMMCPGYGMSINASGPKSLPPRVDLTSQLLLLPLESAVVPRRCVAGYDNKTRGAGRSWGWHLGVQRCGELRAREALQCVGVGSRGAAAAKIGERDARRKKGPRDSVSHCGDAEPGGAVWAARCDKPSLASSSASSGVFSGLVQSRSEYQPSELPRGPADADMRRFCAGVPQALPGSVKREYADW